MTENSTEGTLDKAKRLEFCAKRTALTDDAVRELWRKFQKEQSGQAKLSIPALSRTVIENSTRGVLSTFSTREETQGFPMASSVNYFPDPEGKPIFFLTDLSEHSANIRKDGRVSFLVAEESDLEERTQKVILTGIIEEVKTETNQLREMHLKKFPKAIMYINLLDFHWYRMFDIIKGQYLVDIGAIARTGRMSGEQYLGAVPDSVAQFSVPICKHMNEQHLNDVMAMAVSLTGFELDSVLLRRLDQLGMDIHCENSKLPPFTCRVAFKSPATNRAEVKERVIALTKEAHEATGFKYQQNQRA